MKDNKTEREVKKAILDAYNKFLKGTGITYANKGRVMFIETFLDVWNEEQRSPKVVEKEIVKVVKKKKVKKSK